METNRTEVVKAKLQRLRGQWLRVADESGVKYKTIKNLMQGKVKDPRSSNIDKLHDYLTKE
jgi:predicted transcriptional regulator